MKRVLRAFAALGMWLMFWGCNTPQNMKPSNLDDEQIKTGIAVGFDRSAGMVIWDNGTPAYEEVPTRSPVLHFAGFNIEYDMLAYTTLDRAVVGTPNNRRNISWEEGQSLTLDELAPSGELYIEHAGEQRLVSRPEEFVISARWSPIDPDILAYGYNNAEGSGIAIVDLTTMTCIENVTGELIPDTFDWNDYGTELVYYVYDHPRARSVPGHQEIDVPWRAQVFDLVQKGLVSESDPLIKRGTIRPSFVDDSLEVTLPNGRLKLPRPQGGDQVIFEDEFGNVVTTFRAEQVRGYNERGIVFVNSAADRMDLYVFDGQGNEPIAMMGALTAVTYYIPIAYGPTVNFTQVGASYSGGGCNVSTHSSGSSMAYAVDVQISGAIYDTMNASGTGTVASFVKTVTCNSLDSVGCGIYVAGCGNSNSGWGNDVILAHADGYWTKYTHLENGANFKVSTVGASASAGCWLADEGGTGASSGNKNGCGDHVHFQRQSSSSLSGTSVTVSFVEDATLTSADCVAKTPTVGGSSCPL